MMRRLALCLALVLCLADLTLAQAGRRGGRRQAGGRRQTGGRRQAGRRGRQEAAGGGYDAPLDDVPVYAASDAVATYEGGAGDDPLAALGNSIPGVPGEDYPIYAEVPESGFACDGQVDGGYYADPEAECQAFHICASDGNGGLTKYSFLCPNGTLFQQQYFVCDWWFNVDCSLAEEFYGLNDENAAEREANSPAEAGGDQYQGGAGGRGGGGGRGGAGGSSGGRRGGSGASRGSSGSSSPTGSYSGPRGSSASASSPAGSYSSPGGAGASADAGYGAPGAGGFSDESAGGYGAPGLDQSYSAGRTSRQRSFGRSFRGSRRRNSRQLDAEETLEYLDEQDQEL